MRWQLLDRIEALEIGQSAIGFKTYVHSEPFFQDHFPGFPVVPGVLIMESLAQLSGKLIGYTVKQNRGDWPFPILSMMNNVKFRKFIPPDTLIQLETEISALRDEMAAVHVKARVGKKVHAQAEQIFVFNAVPLADDVERLRVEQLESKELARLWPDLPGGVL